MLRVGFAIWVAVGAMAPAAVHADDPPAIEGVVVALGRVDEQAALTAARTAGGARWRMQRLRGARRAAEASAADRVAAVRAAYLEADFLRCLSALQEPALDIDRLLEAGRRAQAAAVGVFGAACARGAGDEDLGRRLLERVIVAELDVREPLGVTSPEVQALAEQVRAAVLARPRVRVVVRAVGGGASEPRAVPAAAQVSLDGSPHRCASPCALELVPGDHVIVVDALAYATRVQRSRIEAAGEIALAMDPAPAPLVREQIARALASGVSPGDASIARAASTGFEARVVVLVWPSRTQVRALAWDRARDRAIARTAVPRERGESVAVSQVIEEWRGVTEPAPLTSQPWFWVGIGAAAVLAGVITYLLVGLPEDNRHDIVFEMR